MNPLSDFDLTCSGSDVEEQSDMKPAGSENMAPAFQEAAGTYSIVHGLNGLQQLPFNPMGDVLRAAPFPFSFEAPLHNDGYGGANALGYGHPEPQPPSLEAGGTIAPHQMHVNPDYTMSRTGATHRNGLSIFTERSNHEAETTAASSHAAIDTSDIPEEVDAKQELLEPAIQQPSAKRRRRTGGELQEDKLTTTKGTICGLNGCRHKLTKSITDDRKHVRDHYQVKSAYSVGSSSESQSAGSSSSSVASRSQSPGEASSSEAEAGEVERLRCRYGACELTFGRMQDLMKHIESIHWRRNFKCEKCGRELTQRWCRDRHLKSNACSQSRKASKPRRGKK
ncbi:hypothetical protein FKP32DRAFT_1600178 [Trametes sanguinea]|nr:hypothetical protein FKP32DRAFT_1600178 [Trametes sanguinea]